MSADKSVYLFGFLLLSLAWICFFCLDKPLATALARLSPETILLFKGFTFLADPSVNLTVLPVFFLIFRKHKPLMWMVGKLLVAISLANIATSCLKLILGRARPDLFLDYGIFGFYFFQSAPDYLSFPSGHAACCGALWGGLFYVMPKYKFFFLGLGIFLALTRVFLLQHFASDVVAGFAIGLISSYIIVRKSPGLWQNFKDFLWTHT